MFEIIMRQALMLSAAVGISHLLIPHLITFAFKHNIIDRPGGALKLHKRPTAYLGGVAVAVASFVSYLFAAPNALITGSIMTLFAGAFALLGLGLWDDQYHLSPGHKFLGHAAVMLFLLLGGLYTQISFLPFFLSLLVSGFWMVSIMNAINLVDVMDGLASTMTLFILSSFLLVSLATNNPSATYLLTALIGALAGFLRFNGPRARIYLGDAGALFIGGVLAGVPFLFNWSLMGPGAILVPVALCAPILLEGLSLIVIRLYKGIPFFMGSNDHLKHYLMAKGWDEYHILFFVGLFTVLPVAPSLLLLYRLINVISFIMSGLVYTGAWCAAIYSPLLSMHKKAVVSGATEDIRVAKSPSINLDMPEKEKVTTINLQPLDIGKHKNKKGSSAHHKKRYTTPR